jgi:iron complex outermembrane receptor protein
MSNFVPGLTYSTQLDRPVIRGLARSVNIFTIDSAVAIYYDDVYSASTFLVGRDDMLIDTVQVLLGPQGTLYGRNSIGGLIDNISKRPTEAWSGEARAIFGNYGYIKTEGTISGPIADHLSFRLSFYDLNQTRGYYHNLVPGVPGAGDIRHDPYFEGQLEYKTDKNDAWLDVYGYTFNNDRGGPGSLVEPVTGPYDISLTPLGAETFGPNFAYGPTSGPACLPALALAGCFSATGQPLGPIPGSVVGNVVSQNPAITNLRNYASAQPESINLRDAFTVNFHFTHHFDGFDLRYVGGYSQYKYSVASQGILVPNDLSPITSYQIPLLPAAAGGLCAAGLLGPCGPLTVHPRTIFTYATNTKWDSQELTLLSNNDSPLQYIVGAYYYHESDDNPETWNEPDQPQLKAPIALIPLITAGAFVPAAPNPTGNFGLLDYQTQIYSVAGYSQVDWKITPTLKVTGGIRYTYDWKRGFEETRILAFSSLLLNPAVFGSAEPAIDITPAAVSFLPAQGVTCAVAFPTTGRYAGAATRCLGDHSSAFSGTAGIEWTPDHDTLVYARYNRGYKAFGFNAGFNGAFPEAKPEYVNDFEAGIKKSFGRTLTIDVDGFYYDYINDQVPITVAVGSPPTLISEFTNVPKAVSEGIELEANWIPINHLALSLVYGFNHTSISSSCNVPTATGFCVVDALAPTVGLQSLKGNPLPQAPENKVAFNALYTIPLQWGDLILSGTYIWKDQSYSAIFKTAYYNSPSWDQVNFRLTWRGHHDRYEIIGFVNNVFNTLGYDAAAGGGFNLASQGTGLPEYTHLYDLTPPRTYGIELHYKF